MPKPLLNSKAGATAIFLLMTLSAGPVLRAEEAHAPLSPEGVEFFEKNIRPLLVENCYKCHSAEADELKGGLRLDTSDGILRGGDSELPAVVPGDPDRSRLIEAVQYQNHELRMPPKHQLPEAQVANLVEWVRMGAPDPRPTGESAPLAPVVSAAATADSWSFHAPQDQPVPEVKDAAWVRNDVDRFILAKLEEKGLKPSPEADRYTLIRRATFDLTGLPPTPEEVEAFKADTSPDAYEKLIERLLASPRYGERWGRYWLDLARYSDTKGYIYGREERQFVHAHVYRDWVIRALNEDMPYDRFVTLQIAADALEYEPGFEREDLAAMGFLTVGRRFLGVTHDIIDDRIDVVTRTTQGLTVSCARCHDHKFDPIPTADYYSLYGVFSASTEKMLPLDETPKDTDEYRAYVAGLEERQKKLNDTFTAQLEALTTRLRAQTPQYLAAVLDVEKLTTEEFYELRGPEDINPVVVRQWAQYLFQTRMSFHPVFAPWHALADLAPQKFKEEAPGVLAKFSQDTAGEKVNPLVLKGLTESPLTSMADVAAAYGKILTDVNAAWLQAAQQPGTTALPDPDQEQVRQVLYAANSPVNVPPGSIADTEWFFDEGTRIQLTNLQAEIDRWNISSAAAPPHALIMEDRPAATMRNPRVFKRGSPATKGEEVPRQYLSIVSGPDRKPFESGSGRLEMARLIASPENPLTSRVMVNRIWAYHFGAGLVTTLSDFGTRASPPSHPELLDWLAVRFVEQGWSVKAMHRLMMLSATYRQSSSENPQAAAVDPQNVLLWRMNRTRLDFEAMRDALLAASGELSPEAGGKPVDISSTRRTVYSMIDRQFLPGVFRVFDFASPDLHIPQRSETTVPQQALFFMNGDFVAARARALAARPDVAAATTDEERIHSLYRAVYQRPATETEVAAALQFLRPESQAPAPTPVASIASSWKYGYGEYDSASDRLKAFNPLPHFTGNSWQGGPAWPDTTLGWVQITATGGHAGNDLAHAAVRRWVAPRDMAVKIEGTVLHEYADGDGITARIISGTGGTLGHWVLHNSSAPAVVERLEVKQGDTIDFVVDFNAGLSSDMFTWAPTVTALDAPAGGSPETWNAATDLPTGPVEPTGPVNLWEMFAHALLLSNEFMFVD